MLSMGMAQQESRFAIVVRLAHNGEMKWKKTRDKIMKKNFRFKLEDRQIGKSDQVK